MIEIERKFLIDKEKIPNITVREYQHILQAYPDWDFDKFIFRLRVIRHHLVENDKLLNTEYVQCFKEKESFMRKEIEIDLSLGQFTILSPLCTHVLEKHRYKVLTKDKKQTIDLDFYLNNLTGLITAEVEFKSKEHAKLYIPELWFGQEITNDDKYSNYSLAKNGLEK